MSMRVLYNGAVLVRPGGATRVDASLFASAGLSGVGVVGLIGEADGGEPDSIQIFSNPQLARSVFRGGPLADSAALAFQPGNDPRIQGGASTLVCVKTNTSTQSTRTFEGTGTAYAITTAGSAAPYNLEPAQTLVISVNGGGDLTATFNATRALKAGAGAVGVVGAGTFTVQIDNGDVQSITVGGEASAAALAVTINTQLLNAVAVVNGTAVDIRSDRRGTSSEVDILSLGATTNTSLTLGVATGTGNVANIDLVTAAEAKTIIEAAVAGTTVSGDTVQIQSNLISTGTIQVKNTSTATAFGFDNAVHSASAPVDVMTLTSKDYGVHTNKISAQISDSGGGKMIELIFNDSIRRIIETSPVLGATAEFTLVYNGNATTAVMTVSATQIVVTLAGDQTDDSEDLTVPFTTYTTLQEVIDYVNAQTGYAAVAVTNNPFVFAPGDLDYVTSVNVKTTPYSAYAKLYRVIQWVNENSILVDAARETNGPTAPTAIGPVLLTGGTRGTSNNTKWQNALDALGTQRVNEVVPLMSRDLSLLGQGSTATFATVAAATDAHVAFFSSTKGKSERQAYIGMKGNKTQVQAQSGILNSFHTCLSCQKPTVIDATNNLRELEEYAFAVIQAGLRAGAELAEPLTWKYMRISDLTQDASWNPRDHGDEMILAGVLIGEKVDRKGFRIMKGITTFTREDNDAYTEESIVMGWKNAAYEYRTYLEDLFTGRRVTVDNIGAVRQQAEAKLSELRKAGQITDSVLPDGTRVLAFRNLSIQTDGDKVYTSVVMSPTPGINFILNDMFLVPAQISA